MIHKLIVVVVSVLLVSRSSKRLFGVQPVDSFSLLTTPLQLHTGTARTTLALCMSSTSTADTSKTMTLVTGVKDIVDHYDVFLLDMWGVMHDGSTPYDGVLDVIQQLVQAKKRLIILSNSSKRKDHSIRMLQKLGFDPNDFEQILTSGEIAFHMLRNMDRWSLLESIEFPKAFCLGSGDGDKEYCESCGWSLAPVDEASLVVARGTFTVDDGTTVVNKRDDEQAYERSLDVSLQKAAARLLPMMVCNPDKIRPDVERPPMPGKIGDSYEEALGGGQDAEALVQRIGKPFRDVYDIALKDTPDLSRVVMVGDALETDITGGSAMGIDTIWVLKDGIHSPDLDDDVSLEEEATAILESFNRLDGTYAKGRRLSPTILMPRFRW